MSNLIYCPLPIYRDRAQIEALLNCGNIEELMILPLAVGADFPDWKYAQDLCLRLAEHPDHRVRANSCLGLAYIARTQERLEKHLVKPVLLRELRTSVDSLIKGRIQDAISDINNYLQWDLAHKHKDI